MQTIAHEGRMLGLLVWFVALSTSSGQDPDGPQWITIGGQSPPVCLDTYAGRKTAGTGVELRTCDPKADSQKWKFSPGTFKLRSVLDESMCIDAGDMKKGTEVQLQTCNINASQMWSYSSNKGYHSIYLESTSASGGIVMCMNVEGGTFQDGAKAQVSECDGKADQNWAVMAPWSPFKITVAGQNKCLDLYGQKTDNGTPIDVWDCDPDNKNKGQQWYFVEGSYNIKSALDPTKCVDASNMKYGTNLAIWDCNDQDQQKWGYDPKMKTIYLTQQNPTLCMCLSSFNNGSPLHLYTCNGAGTEQWQITDLQMESSSDQIQMV